MWVQLTHFEFDRSVDDRSVLAELVASPGYVHDYASPFDNEAPVIEPALHGRWFRECIQADSFEPWTASSAQDAIRAWADNQEWTEPGYRQPPDVHERLGTIYALLHTGSVFKLQNPGVEAEHEYGWVTGGMGFHEFVAIDRGSERIHVIVASDD